MAGADYAINKDCSAHVEIFPVRHLSDRRYHWEMNSGPTVAQWGIAAGISWIY